MNIDPVSTSGSLTSIRQTAMNGASEALRNVERETRSIASGNLDVRSVAELDQQTTLYSINLKLLAMSDEMTGQVLDLLA
ncbi:MAG TPA: hypothetical protein VJ960_09020 [Oceanipulchritudo sp.]|nr:hypothetical protein [Oceanipulchritudo sp.]